MKSLVSSRVKSSRLNVVVSENIGLSNRMCLSCTIESAISCVQYRRQLLTMPYGKAVQRDIEDVPARPLEPRRHAAELVVLLEQQHAPPGPRQHVRRRQPGQAAADDDDVVLVLGVFEKIRGMTYEPTDGGKSRIDVSSARRYAWSSVRSSCRLGLGSLCKQCRLAIAMPLVMLPMMPTKPWSVPQTNRFSRCVRPSSCLSGAP